jgi:hypothetical protein
MNRREKISVTAVDPISVSKKNEQADEADSRLRRPQLIGQAFGAHTFKLKFGHHGANHPVMNQATRRVEITSHNHGFAVDIDSIEKEKVRGTMEIMMAIYESVRIKGLVRLPLKTRDSPLELMVSLASCASRRPVNTT